MWTASMSTRLPADTVALLDILMLGLPKVGSLTPEVVLSTFMMARPAEFT
jgi:hypothetical protein